MNEWSPGGNYSCPGTPNQNGRSHRYLCDESGKRSKPLTLNKRGQPDSKSRSCLQYSTEDVPKGLSAGSNRKAVGSGTSDPRFKRVVPSGVQNDACVGTEGKTRKPLVVSDEKSATDSTFPLWNAPEFIPNKVWCDSAETSEQSVPKTKGEAEKVTGTEGFNFNLKAVDSLAFNHDVVNQMCKESDSECTINTRNTSLVSDEYGQEISNALARVPSPVRVKKVENWMHDQGPKLEKKHSVITVIGQMQEPDVLSSALQEIDKRRKLVKELDRFAVCKKIIETDKEKEVSDLMLKFSTLNSNKSVVLCGSNGTINTSSRSIKDCEDKLNKDCDLSNTEYSVSNCNEMNGDSSVPLSKKSSTARKNLKKSQEGGGNFSKGRLQTVFSSFPYQKSLFIWVIFSGAMIWFAFFSIQKGAYMSFDLFNSKPKPITWYERIFKWLWEIFRPSNSYHRSSQWRSY